MVKNESIAWKEREKKGTDPIYNWDTEEWGFTDMRTFTTNLWQKLMVEMRVNNFSKNRKHLKTVHPPTNVRKIMESSDPYIETPQGIIYKPSAWNSESDKYWKESFEYTEITNKVASQMKREGKMMEKREADEAIGKLVKLLLPGHLLSKKDGWRPFGTAINMLKPKRKDG